MLLGAGRAFKILGNANHQDFAAVGVAVPDHLQWYRVQAQKNWGSNGWRTAHNPPTPALLHARTVTLQQRSPPGFVLQSTQ